MNTQEVIVAVQTLEILFKIIRTAIHKTASPEDIDTLLQQVKNSTREFLEPVKEEKSPE